MKSKVIGFDLDGTVIDHSANKARLAREYGYDLIPEQTPSGVLSRFLPPDIRDEVQVRLYGDVETSLRSQLMPGALEALQAVKASGQPYYALSRRYSEVIIPVLEHFGLWPEIFNSENTRFVNEMKDKAPIARELDLTHYFDDRLASLLGRLDFIPQRYLFDPFDVLPESSDYTKVRDWAEIRQLLV